MLRLSDSPGKDFLREKQYQLIVRREFFMFTITTIVDCNLFVRLLYTWKTFSMESGNFNLDLDDLDSLMATEVPVQANNDTLYAAQAGGQAPQMVVASDSTNAAAAPVHISILKPSVRPNPQQQVQQMVLQQSPQQQPQQVILQQPQQPLFIGSSQHQLVLQQPQQQQVAINLRINIIQRIHQIIQIIHLLSVMNEYFSEIYPVIHSPNNSLMNSE